MGGLKEPSAVQGLPRLPIVPANDLPRAFESHVWGLNRNLQLAAHHVSILTTANASAIPAALVGLILMRGPDAHILRVQTDHAYHRSPSKLTVVNTTALESWVADSAAHNMLR